LCRSNCSSKERKNGKKGSKKKQFPNRLFNQTKLKHSLSQSKLEPETKKIKEKMITLESLAQTSLKLFMDEKQSDEYLDDDYQKSFLKDIVGIEDEEEVYAFPPIKKPSDIADEDASEEGSAVKAEINPEVQEAYHAVASPTDKVVAKRDNSILKNKSTRKLQHAKRSVDVPDKLKKSFRKRSQAVKTNEVSHESALVLPDLGSKTSRANKGFPSMHSKSIKKPKDLKNINDFANTNSQKFQGINKKSHALLPVNSNSALRYNNRKMLNKDISETFK